MTLGLVNSCKDLHLVLISNSFKNTFAFLVSSQSIKSDSFRVSIALNEKSPKLPIGVATKYNVPEK